MLDVLHARFVSHPHRHAGVRWEQVAARLAERPETLSVLELLESTGGEPDVVGIDNQTGAVTFYDCSVESPAGRRSLCLDEEALLGRKRNSPRGSAAGEATAAGVRLMSEEEYHHLQGLGEFDLRTSTWLATPPHLRALGGALFGDRRYGRVFVYHNGADSYYASRGWRGVLSV
ncbi:MULTISPECIES: DUF4256 domain-containing protein [unclassified Actinomyces]|uniref:DUF4256 domain-containing protein n=1 Tax=unclassified Actinomyces TaxID=2609248 RepID=UPI002018266C|nr:MULTISPECIES: DUF4256 domain-containing protein [unclassified Actinomyces]MCL3776867.1 DUF4256 domain-containing protein [Actinomyces sp. AC-20-1]MCL3790390.1 DUF4256 domain-containing protein [Actinomyces sp. 187325]MCL3792804.1 DUF4256 domain-containing protein [Actinomyces sp. 186855]MCL3795278.1 DUF4256 domain-containing protein [Actinomyces sp. 217892]